MGGAVSVTQVRERAPYSLHLTAPDTAVCQKTKGGCFQGYHQTGAAAEEITHTGERRMRHFSSHLYLYMSVKR